MHCMRRVPGPEMLLSIRFELHGLGGHEASHGCDERRNYAGIVENFRDQLCTIMRFLVFATLLAYSFLCYPSGDKRSAIDIFKFSAKLCLIFYFS